MLPHQISVVVAGVQVLDAQIQISDPIGVDADAFLPKEGMRGPAIVIRGPMRFMQLVNNSSGGSTDAAQPVVIHAVLDTAGKVLEAEALQTSDSARAEAALEAVKQTNYAPARGPFQREVFINLRFVSALANASTGQ